MTKNELETAVDLAIRDAKGIAVFAAQCRTEDFGMPVMWMGDLLDRLSRKRKLPPRRSLLGLAAWVVRLVEAIGDDPEAREMAITKVSADFDLEKERRSDVLRELAIQALGLLHEEGIRLTQYLPPAEWFQKLFAVGVGIAVVAELGKDPED